MTRLDNFQDANAPLTALLQAVRDLQRAPRLGNASVSRGTLRILESGTVAADGLEISTQNGGQVASGSAFMSAAGGGRTGAGGTFIGSSGAVGRDDATQVPFSHGLKSYGTVEAVGNSFVGVNAFMTGEVSGGAGLRTPWKGGSALVEAIMGIIEGAAATAQSTATGAMANAATADAKAVNAQNTANQALAAAGGGASQTQVDRIDNDQSKIFNYAALLNQRLNALDGGTNPPPVKG